MKKKQEWRALDGRIIPISKMNIGHLLNCIRKSTELAVALDTQLKFVEDKKTKAKIEVRKKKATDSIQILNKELYSRKNFRDSGLINDK